MRVVNIIHRVSGSPFHYQLPLNCFQCSVFSVHSPFLSQEKKRNAHGEEVHKWCHAHDVGTLSGFMGEREAGKIKNKKMI